MPTRVIGGVDFWIYAARVVIDPNSRLLSNATVTTTTTTGGAVTVRDPVTEAEISPLVTTGGGLLPALLISSPQVLQAAGSFTQEVSTSDIDDLVAAAAASASSAATSESAATTAVAAAQAFLDSLVYVDYLYDPDEGYPSARPPQLVGKLARINIPVGVLSWPGNPSWLVPDDKVVVVESITPS